MQNTGEVFPLVSEICKQTDRQTDSQTHRNTFSPSRGEGEEIMRMINSAAAAAAAGPRDAPRAMRSTRMTRMMVGLMGITPDFISSSMMPVTDSSTIATSS